MVFFLVAVVSGQVINQCFDVFFAICFFTRIFFMMVIFLLDLVKFVVHTIAAKIILFLG